MGRSLAKIWAKASIIKILCLVDIAQHAVDVKGQRVAIPLHQQLSGSFVSARYFR